MWASALRRRVLRWCYEVDYSKYSKAAWSERSGCELKLLNAADLLQVVFDSQGAYIKYSLNKTHTQLKSLLLSVEHIYIVHNGLTFYFRVKCDRHRVSIRRYDTLRVTHFL